MKVKICGLSRPADIDAVNAARPDYCGFVVDVPKSHRSVTPQTLRCLRKALEPGIAPVGVFVDEPPETVAALLNDGTLAAVQLHGHEDYAYLAALRALTAGPVWQAFQVRTPEDVRRANESAADLALLDAGQGAGKAFDWALLHAVTRPFALAGGLNLDNIPAAMQTGAVLLDVSSGVETNQKKDFYKIQAIVAMIRGD